jgi:hypothetical protein
MQQRSWSPDSSAGSTSSAGSHSIQGAAAARATASAVADLHSDQGGQWQSRQSVIQLGVPAARVSTSGSSTTTTPPDSPVLQEQLPLSPVTCAVVTDPETSYIQRSDSLDHLDELIASCHGAAEIPQDDPSAAEHHAQQGSPQTAGRHPATIESPAADADTSRPLATSTKDGDTAAEHDQQPGGGRRDTDASIGAENTTLRQELSRLRAEHVTTRIQCVLLE